MAALNTPLAMIVIGYGLYGAKLGNVLKNPSVWVAGAIRLFVYPLLFVALLYPFRSCLDRDMMLALSIAASAPVAAMVSMFATKFHRDVDTGVAMVSGTTLLSIITMPVVIAIAMAVL
jgi:predicted permease